jgi:hypothetical protein
MHGAYSLIAPRRPPACISLRPTKLNECDGAGGLWHAGPLACLPNRREGGKEASTWRRPTVVGGTFARALSKVEEIGGSPGWETIA